MHLHVTASWSAFVQHSCLVLCWVGGIYGFQMLALEASVRVPYPARCQLVAKQAFVHCIDFPIDRRDLIYCWYKHELPRDAFMN